MWAKSEATFEFGMLEITYVGQKAKRYFVFGCHRSPMSSKRKATFQIRKCKVTHTGKKEKRYF